MKASNPVNLPMGLERDILKSLRVPLAVIDNNFRFLWLNKEMAWIYQTQPEQATGTICYKLNREQEGPCCDCPLIAVQKSGRREISQKYKDFPDGIRRYGEISAFPIIEPPKKMVATLMMIMDVTHKIMVDLDSTYQILSRLTPSAQGWMPQSLPPTGRNQVKKRGKQTRFGISSLTRRETQVLRLLAKGSSNTRIAAILEISPHTVKSHVINIFNKLGVNDRIQAAVVAARQRIIE